MNNFVVQLHSATRLHYDFRLEIDGVLKSWTIPKGPSLNPKYKRLAIMVNDHPTEYANFEGVIPKGSYGAGPVIVWDKGKFKPDNDPKKSLDKGHLSFNLEGNKLKGGFNLIKLKTKRDTWLLVKKQDKYARKKDITEDGRSVLSGLKIEQISIPQNTQEAIIVGFTVPPHNKRYFGSLILGVYKNNKLEYTGSASRGFTEDTLSKIYWKLNKLRRNKAHFDPAPKTKTPINWVKPKLVCEVKINGLTFMALRENINPKKIKAKKATI